MEWNAVSAMYKYSPRANAWHLTAVSTSGSKQLTGIACIIDGARDNPSTARRARVFAIGLGFDAWQKKSK